MWLFYFTASGFKSLNDVYLHVKNDKKKRISLNYIPFLLVMASSEIHSLGTNVRKKSKVQ